MVYHYNWNRPRKKYPKPEPVPPKDPAPETRDFSELFVDYVPNEKNEDQ